MKDSLGDRMKGFYEDRFRVMLPRRTNTIIRLDGKAFHTFTKGFDRPFDEKLSNAMDMTCKKVCESIQGAKFGYVQSDEISILITDYDDISTHGWYDNNMQKMISVSASLATAYFNEEMQKIGINKLAFFDSRVFQISYDEEVVNYFIWRQQDATRNSISMAAQSNFSSSALHKKSSSEMQDMLMTQKGINWNNYSTRFKRGGGCKITDVEVKPGVIRKRWEMLELPIFSQDRNYIKSLLPNESEKN